MFFRDANPFGFVLFQRNCASPEQVQALVTALRESVDRPDAPVLIDQEGGRVARLRPPAWPAWPAARRIGDRARENPAAGVRAAWINARLIAATLFDLGIDVDCAPVCDVPVEGSDNIIGDRAFATDPLLVAQLAGAACAGLLAGGVLPVVKHTPGHGRALVDSHRALPRVTASLAELDATDFLPFRALSGQPLAMVAHVVYEAIDPDHAGSVSAKVIGDVVRQRLGFNGLLLSDDLSMQALSGTLAERAAAVSAAGCDIALHCNGDLGEMAAIAAVTPALAGRSLDRWIRARAGLPSVADIDEGALRAELDALLGSDA